MSTAALALAACGGGGGGPTAANAKRSPATRPAARPPSATQQLDALLTRRSAALAQADPRAYAATATGAQRARDRRAARRARGLGIRDPAISVARISVGARRATMTVRSSYRVRGIAGRFAGERRLVAVRTARGWRVASEAARRGRAPWEIGAFDRTRTPHFAVLAPAGAGLAGLPDALEAGYAAMRRVLRAGRLRRRYLVVVAGDARQALALTSGIRGVGRLAAITDSRVREQGPARRAAEVISQRLLVVRPVFAALPPQERTRIVTHELTHAALAGSTSGRTPAWLIEGIALYISGDDRVLEAAAAQRAGTGGGQSLARLSRPDRIAQQSGARQGGSYAYASAATYHLVERFGARAVLRLYEAFNDERIPGRAGDPRTTDRVLRATLGISLRRLDRDLARWIAARAGG